MLLIFSYERVRYVYHVSIWTRIFSFMDTALIKVLNQTC
ncbi:hypothetical protein B4110_2227 [Parageobacillus toebii]|uniref:Uncharacterized protein n=1 Tax=Parageobacillus toebii TaxID=153151 RepID=A0A150N035_9BACL|nr:hypothetical protein B4110_2227 [Parageobacillus toebii]